MKDAIQLFATYNSDANGAMYQVLQQVTPKSLLTEERHSYYGSIMGVLNHVVLSDLTWLSRFKQHFPSLRSLEHQLVRAAPESLSERRYETLEEFRRAREEVDRLIVAFADEVEEESLGTRFTYRNSKGAERTVELGGAVLHMFNHQTHHRGAVAQILDELDIKNDYSNLLGTVLLGNER